MKKIFFVGIVVSLAIAGCKDDPAPTKTQLLTGVKWRLVQIFCDGLTAPAPNCYDDDELTFDIDGNFEWDHGADKCYDTDPASLEGTWEFDYDETVILWITDGDYLEMEIRKLTTEVLEIRFFSGYTYRYHFEAIN